MKAKPQDLIRWVRVNFKSNCYRVGVGLMVLSPLCMLGGGPDNTTALQGGALALAALAFFKASELYPPKP